MASSEGLQQPFRANVEALIAAARAEGVTVTISSGRRTFEEQVALRRAHCGTSHYAIYEMPASECHPDTARPGTSKHEVGLAVDFGGNLAWVARNAARFDMKRTVPSEDWHYEPTSGAAGQSPTASTAPGPDGSGSSGGGGGLAGIIDFAKLVLSGNFWLRVAHLSVGVSLVLIGIVIVRRDSIEAGAKLAMVAL